MSKAPKDLRIPIMMSSAEVEAIDEWRFANKIATRAEAVRRLCLVALTIFGSREAILRSRERLVGTLEDLIQYIGDLDNDLEGHYEFLMGVIQNVGDGAVEISNVNRAISLASPQYPDEKVMEGSIFLRKIADESRVKIEANRKARLLKSKSNEDEGPK